MIGITVIILLILGIVIFLLLPFSPAKASFERITEIKTKGADHTAEIFTEGDIEGLPRPVQQYFRHCRFLGTPKMAYMKAELNHVDFVMSDTKTIKIDYKQYNLVEKPERFALISSSLSGIPFEGLDSYENGKGSMRGMLAKVIPLFDQRGENMDRACLVTWLAECLMVPGAALQDFVKWEPMDDTNVRASITWEGINAEGVFTFDASGKLLSFRTGDRVAVDMEGNETEADWSAYFRDYRSVNGILQPKAIQAVWHYEKGDCIYFNQNGSEISIRYQ